MREENSREGWCVTPHGGGAPTGRVRRPAVDASPECKVRTAACRFNTGITLFPVDRSQGEIPEIEAEVRRRRIRLHDGAVDRPVRGEGEDDVRVGGEPAVGRRAMNVSYCRCVRSPTNEGVALKRITGGPSDHTIANRSLSRMMRYSFPSRVTSVPEYFP